MKNAFASLVLCVSAIAASSTCALADCLEVAGPFRVKIIITINGVPTVDFVDIPLGLNPGWGTGINYPYYDPETEEEPCPLTTNNCSSSEYEYFTLSIDSDWFVIKNIGGTNYTITKAHNEAYWDWYYAGYTKVGSIDYTKNCYGYAFGVGDWPNDGTYGHEVLLNVPICYATDTLATADLAADDGHAIKVTGGTCNDAYTSWDIATSTSEKFRESAIYTQSQRCDAGVDIGRAHSSYPTVYTEQ